MEEVMRTCFLLLTCCLLLQVNGLIPYLRIVPSKTQYSLQEINNSPSYHYHHHYHHRCSQLYLQQAEGDEEDSSASTSTDALDDMSSSEETEVTTLWPTNLNSSISSSQANNNNNNNNNEEEDITNFAKSEIRTLVEVMIKIDIAKGEDGLKKFGPPFLLENSHVLCKGRLYESVIDDMIKQSSTSSRTENLERVHALISGFLTAERKARARTKVNYILAGASSNRLNEAISLLVDSEEVDDDLVAYLDYLLQKEALRSKGIESLLEEERSDEDDDLPNFTSSAFSKKNNAEEVLRMVKRRLLAEVRTQGKSDVRLLAKLLQITDADERLAMLKKDLTKIEYIESFTGFLEEGIAFLKDQGLKAKDKASGDTIELPSEVISKMEGLLMDVRALSRGLETGSREGSIFEINSEDEV